MQTLKVISVLLAYPRPETLAALPEMRAIVEHERALPAEAQGLVLAFIDALSEADLLDVQEGYVALFDRGRALSLHLFEHLHGESRARGQAMVDLIDLYRRHGFELAARELPDYLPLFLEYLSCRPGTEALALLRDALSIVTLIGARLKERASPYHLLFDALEALVGPAEDADEIRGAVRAEGEDETITDMDRIWEEETVSFLAPAACASNASVQPVRWVSRGDAGKGAEVRR